MTSPVTIPETTRPGNPRPVDTRPGPRPTGSPPPSVPRPGSPRPSRIPDRTLLLVSAALPDRFLSKFVIGETGCWLWTAGLSPKGYGRFRDAARIWRAHRYAFTALVGTIPDGLQLDHLCRVRHCVNPQHLEPVTNRENTRRGESVAAQRARQTHCLRGHELSGANLYVWPRNGRRACRTCRSSRPHSARVSDRAQSPDRLAPARCSRGGPPRRRSAVVAD